ncbi:TROVE domain-containing protein [Silvibacterium dinghuense]|uniref:TROVE domain-containing protein n=2 Tax=Silvibacterium dinghuense TaxID=1560006 RepID=A0A4Q1SKB7_9BACT|nr:TROVE domain-containing protein [Silvibacterium dinghuense]GGG95453.1 ribonucleoprotein [Silvibacterium dinghuense]
MARLNILKLSHLGFRGAALRAHEGAPAAVISAEEQLRRAVLACMLWENEFYEDGESIATRISALVPRVAAETVAALAVEARERMKLRHVPLLLVREMARYETHRGLVAATLARVIQRADELAEFLAIYWKDGRQPLSAQVKKGLAAAFTRFDSYALAKYNREGAVKLRDVLFLSHAKPVSSEQALVWRQLIDGTLPSPETWEVRLSRGEQKREVWESMLRENSLGALALLRNLRNMQAAGVDEALVRHALELIRVERVLPFRFLAAARYAPQWEPELEQAMFASVIGQAPFAGRTVLLVDVSGSMGARLSSRSEMLRMDAAAGLAVLLREVSAKVSVYTFSDALKAVSPRRGFALRDAIVHSQPHGGTQLGRALGELRESYDRLVIITDEQSHDRVPAPRGRGYVINVASARNGVGYGVWTHIDGWSEAVVDYIRATDAGSA